MSQGFSVKPAGNSSASLSDLIDLNDLFQDDFFPPGLDFSSFGGPNEQSTQNSFSADMESILSMPAGLDFNQNANTNPGQQAPYSSEYFKPGMIPVGNQQATCGSSSMDKVILIPPSMPSGVQFPAPKITKPPAPRSKKSCSVTDDQLRRAKGSIDSGVETHERGAGIAVVDKHMRKDKEQGLDEDVSEGDEDQDEDQKVERRERNREHAKRSRIRKRVLLETLQDQLENLREQNVRLRRVVVNRIPHSAAQILAACTTEESTLLASLNNDEAVATDRAQGSSSSSSSSSMFKPSRLTSKIASSIAQSHGPASSSAAVAGASAAAGAQSKQYAKVLMEPDYRLIQSLITSQQNFVLSDPSLPDNPIVYASDGFCRLSGYKRQDVLGRNCRFLQGPGTDQAAVDVIRRGVRDGRDISVCLLNYRADGSPFWNQFFLGALKDSDGQVVNYVGVQCQVNAMPVTEIKDRVKKLPMPDDL